MKTRFRMTLPLCLMAGALLPVAPVSAAPGDATPRQFEGEIVVAILSSRTMMPGFEAVAAAYRQHQPNVRVVFETKGGDAGLSYPTWLNTQLNTPDPRPDVVSTNYNRNYSHYVDLDFYRQMINPYSGTPWEDVFDFDYNEVRNARGQRITLGTQGVKVLWYYNRTRFAELGLEAPETWTEFLEACARIKEAGYTPITLSFGLRFHQWLAEILFDQFSRPYVKKIRAQTGDWLYEPGRDGAWTYDPEDPDNDRRVNINTMRLLKAVADGDIRFDTPEFLEVLRALKQVQSFSRADFFLVSPTDFTDSYNLFLREDALIHLDTTRLIPALESDLREISDTPGQPRFEWGFFDTPPLESPMVHGPARAVESIAGEYLGVIRKNERQTERVMDFLMFWLSPEGYQAYVDGLIAAGQFRPSGEILVRGVNLPAEFSVPFSRVPRSGNAEIPLNWIFLLPPPGSSETRASLNALQRYLAGQLSEEAAAARIQAELQASVERILRMNQINPFFLRHPQFKPE